MSYTKARISHKSGMGGAFDPPGYPQHTTHVEYDLHRKPENRSSMSLLYALDCNYISMDIKAEIKSMLTNWDQNKPDLSEEVCQKWIKECLRHFGEHTGVQWIQTFYPEFTGKIN